MDKTHLDSTTEMSVDFENESVVQTGSEQSKEVSPLKEARKCYSVLRILCCRDGVQSLLKEARKCYSVLCHIMLPGWCSELSLSSKLLEVAV